MAASATLNRLELGTEQGDPEERYKRIEPAPTKIEEILVEFLDRDAAATIRT
ncbi:MAG: hypothetical protein ABEK29_07915 [Bradymonadaceae bacterium]